MKKLIIVYTFSPFPCGDANANRLYAYALTMQSVGYRVIVLTNERPREVDYNEETGVYIYRGIEYRSYLIAGLGRVRRTIHRNNILAILNKTITKDEQNNIQFVVTSYRNYNIFLHMYLKYRRIPAIVDVTEWHSSDQYKRGTINLHYRLHDWNIRYLIPKAQNILCITRYLEAFYKSQNCHTLYLPPQIILEDYKPHQLPKLPPIKIFYAGTMQNKDYIGLALEGVAMLTNKEKQRVHCTIAGTDKQKFRKLLPDADYIIKGLGPSLSIIGRIPKEEVEKHLSESHFMMLMRPISRYSSAGFPSKVPEAFAAGVPVITNLTSDLGDYIEDMGNGVVVEDFTAEAFLAAVRKTLKLSDEGYQRMSNKAYKTAATKFDYKCYNRVMQEYLTEIISGKGKYEKN